MDAAIEANQKHGLTETQRNGIGRIAIGIGVTLLGILTGIVVLISGLLVYFLPVSTSVPSWAWMPLAIVDVAFIILASRVRPTWRAMAVGLSGSALVGFLAIIISQSFTMTPPITGADGKPLSGSIAILEKLDLNGSKQWISIRGKDVDKPVLLFLAGGPAAASLSQSAECWRGWKITLS